MIKDLIKHNPFRFLSLKKPGQTAIKQAIKYLKILLEGLNNNKFTLEQQENLYFFLKGNEKDFMHSPELYKTYTEIIKVIFINIRR